VQAPGQKAPLAVIYDSSFEGIDQVLALAMLFGFESAREAKLASLSVSRYDLNAAAFCDAVSRFYGGQAGGGFQPSRAGLPIGFPASNLAPGGKPAGDVPMLMAALSRKTPDGQPVYNSTIHKLNDTADVAAAIRNAITAQAEQNAVVVLSGPATNLVQAMALPGPKDLFAKRVRVLVVADEGLDRDIPAARKLFAEWPTPIVVAGAEASDGVLFPGSSIDKEFTWAPDHPIADAYRAYKPMPYDAPTRTLAAALYAVRAGLSPFTLSEPGAFTILDDGHTKFTAGAGGKQRILIADPNQKERVIQTYVELASAKRAQPGGRGRGLQQQKNADKKAAAPVVAPLLAILAAGLSMSVFAHAATPAEQAEFDKAVQPVFTQSCSQCHNAELLTAQLDVATLKSADSLTANREIWERILRKVSSGQMPPPGAARPPEQQIKALVNFVEAGFAIADKNTKPDPGRVTAHRLNRNEYANTIRDLLAVDFRADKEFPADDSGGGFDNVGEILTVSPVLMERYLNAAERIAARAIGADPLPKPIEVEYHNKDKRIRRVDVSTIEATHRIDFDAEYDIRIGLPGERSADAKPVTMGFWMDGKLLHTQQVETKPSGLVYFDPYSDERMRLYLPAGDHVFRAGFIDDPFVKDLSEKDFYNKKKNKFLESIVFTGPFPSSVEKESRKKILICDPKSGRACIERILTTLAGRAYRRPVTAKDVTPLLRFADMAQADGQSAEQGVQLAIEAMLVSPDFLFRIEHDANPTDPTKIHRVTPVELASRLSYFLWSSMPDDELLGLAESGKLNDAGVLDNQVKRMLADEKSAAFAANFAGQWLETRNLDFVKPDPQKFSEWNPVLRDAMKEETRLFFEHVLRENLPISDFLNAKYTFLNETLAKHYGIAGVTGPDFRRVDLTTDQRGGVLSQAAVLTVSSYPTRTSPVIRGKYILQNILGAPPPPPPPDVPPLNENAVGVESSMRQQMEVHRANAVCASCHGKMDPLGFGLENYDGIGRWRTQDGKFPVDASGTLPNGKTFSTPAEMRAVLTSLLPDFSRCLTEKMLTYALGRGLASPDDRTVDAINHSVAEAGYTFQTLIFEVVRSVPFQQRRGEELSGETSSGAALSGAILSRDKK
jgi:mono/diheme cytochrome c family protein